MSEEGKFPFKENAGATKKDIDRGFQTDEPEEDDKSPLSIYETPEDMPFPNGGFLGRAKGWER